MTGSIWLLEAEFQAETATRARTERARARIATHTRDSLLASPDADAMSNARRTIRHQESDNPDAVHVWLHRLEDDVIDLLPPQDQHRFRSDT